MPSGRPRGVAGGTTSLRAVWLSAAPPRSAIEPLVLQLLEPNLPNPKLRHALLDELSRPVKTADIVLEYLGLRSVGRDDLGDVPLVLVAPIAGKDPWREALLLPGGDCPIGILVKTRDLGHVALVHEAFRSLADPHKTLIRRYAALAARGTRPERIPVTLSPGADGARQYADVTSSARRQIASVLDPSVLLSPDGNMRVQVGSLSETTRNLLRDGLRGEYVFILPHLLFEGRTNYADIEFLIYLNFFVRRGQPTRIAGTARQRRTLERLLTLVIFGVFDPDAGTVPSFEDLQAAYGVADVATYAFLRMTYERYAVRASADRSSAVQGLASYVDFTVLEPGGTVIPIHHAGPDGSRSRLGDVRVASAEPGFDVQITQADGRVAAKRMDVTMRRRPVQAVPGEAAQRIRFGTKRPRFGVTPLGTSHGFDPTGDVTSFVIWINGRGVLVDPSSEALAYLRQIGVAEVDVPFVFLTHIHADHDGGLIEKLLSGGRTTIIASDVVFRSFTEKARLVTGHDVQREGLVNHVAVNPGAPVVVEIGGERATLEARWNLHPIPTNGFKITVDGMTFGYSGDTQYDAALLRDLHQAGELTAEQYEDLLHFFWTSAGVPAVDLLYHEAGIPPIHTDKQQLQALSGAVTSRTFLVHISDREVPAGFVPAKPELFMTQTLLAPTEAVTRQALLSTMRLVSYLYDVPVETIDELLRGGDVHEYAADEAIIHKGPIPDDVKLSFYVVVDGDVAVKDGRRMIGMLGKGDSFGEWGISHQRGFRTADVVAVRPAQCAEFSEDMYRWLIGRYPVVQERIGVIRRLLPRLQMAQSRARFKLQADPAGNVSVLATMTSTQLSSFALFSTVAAFKEGEPIIVEGAEADGFYVLLSGHLVASVGGRVVGDLGEGDIFGEMGLLEGGRRAATVSAVSADAEVLFMSSKNFRDLLHAVPAFALGVRETAAHRLERGQRQG